jgi:NACHT domain/Leucine Rich repeats (2 copies)
MSTLADLLVINLGARFTKLLVESWLGKGATTTVIGDVVDVFKGRIQSAADQKKAKREFEELGDRMARELLPLFERAEQRGQVNVEAVILALESTLGGLTNSRFLVERNLDSGAILAELKQKQPLPSQLFEAEDELYERALERSVRQLVEIASRLPQFEEAFAARSLQQLSRVTTNIDEILAAVRKIEKTVGAEALDKKAREYEIDYRLAVQRNLDYLEIFGIDLPPEARSQKLSVAYISLNLESRSGRSSESLPAETLFDRLGAQEGRLLIRGDAGTGKSTLLRWAAIQAAGAKEIARPVLRDGEAGSTESSWRARVPFLIRLRECKAGSLPSPDKFPEQVAQALGGSPSDWVKSIFDNGRALLLLDGVDEIPNAQREKTRRNIKELVDQFPKTFFIISTRPRAIDPDWLGDLGFFEARINPLSDLDRTRFVARWYEAVGDELKARGKEVKGLAETADALTGELEENPEVARLATNPLLCAMICGLYRERRQKLPERQRQLCEDLCYALLHRRERESGLNLDEFPEPYRRLDYPQKRAAVQELAHHMVLNEYSSLPLEEAQEQIGKALKHFPDHFSADAPVVTEALVERSGILREESPGEISFIHNAFKELLAGDYFAAADDAGLLAKHARDPAWQPVILFSVATDRRGFATKVIQKILDRGWTMSTVDLQAKQLMALKCRASALYVDEKLDLRLRALSKKLFPPRTMEVAEALAASGSFAVPFLTDFKTLNEAETAATVRALRLIGTSHARQALRLFYEDRRINVISELAQAVNPLELKLIQEQLLEGRRVPDGIKTQVVDISPLAELKNLRHLSLAETQVADISPLAQLKDLLSLYLTGTPVANISPLAGLKNLRFLSLDGTQVVNISPLAELENLQDLSLAGTPVVDITPLVELKNLKRIDLSGTKVADISPLMGREKLEIFGDWQRWTGAQHPTPLDAWD